MPNDDRVELRLGQSSGHLQLPRLHHRSQLPHSGSGQVDQRSGRRQRQLPPAPLAGRPDAALGQPARRHHGPGYAPTFTSTPGPYTGSGSDRDPSARGAQREESDGYAEAWFLPAANNIPAGFATEGTWYDFFKGEFQGKSGVVWDAGTATFQYKNDQRAGDLLVSRPHARHDPPERLCGTGGFLSPAAAAPGTYLPPSSPAPPPEYAPTPGSEDSMRSRSPSRTAPSTPTARCSTRTPAILRRIRWALHPRQRRAADLEPGVLWQHHGGQRPHLALPGSRAAPLPLPLPQRLQLPLPDLEDRHRSASEQTCICRTSLLADWRRRRLPARRRCSSTNSLWRRPNGPTSSSTSLGSRSGPSSSSSTRARTSPSEAACRKPIFLSGSRHDRPGDAICGGAAGRA